MIEGVHLTKLRVFETDGGNVMHGMKKTSNGFSGFGEAYFSHIKKNSIKAWKRHKLMTLNLIVPVGKIKFVIFDNRDLSCEKFQEVTISKEHYYRLTIPPMVWVGFQGIFNDESLLLNIADIEHSPEEIDRLDIDDINYDWSKNI